MMNCHSTTQLLISCLVALTMLCLCPPAVEGGQAVAKQGPIVKAAAPAVSDVEQALVGHRGDVHGLRQPVAYPEVKLAMDRLFAEQLRDRQPGSMQVQPVNGQPLPGEKTPAKKPRLKRSIGEPEAPPGGAPGAVPSLPGVAPADESHLPPRKQPGLPRIVTHIPSAAGGQRGIAVGVLPPLRPRYADGAPVVIHVPGGVTTGGTEGMPEYAGLGFLEIRFAFPGGGRGEGTSGGNYDYRGPNCIRALADVIRFATGQLADRQGRKLQELLPTITVLAENVGLVGSSHGGNTCGLAMATHGEEFPHLAFYASMESPYGEGNVNIELGGRDQGLNPAYNPETGVLDLSKLAWSADLPPGPPRRWQGEGAGVRGALFFDLNGDGRFSEPEDYPANAFVQDLGQGPKAWYTPRLIREAEQRKLFGESRPAHVPTLAESLDYWRWRDAAGSIAAAVSKCPQVAVIVYGNERDHVQVAPDHPHILAQLEGFRQAGAKFVRLNPDRAYVARVLASGGPPFLQRPRTFPDNDAGTAWNRGNIRHGLEPADLPMQPYMQAAVCELADRVQAGNWVHNLDAVLYPDAPWTAFFGREFGGPAEERPLPGKPPLGPGGLRPPMGKPPLVRWPLDSAKPSPSADAGRGALQQRVAANAGSRDAPLLFCIGVHVEPLGATVSALARTAADATAAPPRPRRADQVDVGALGRPSYEEDALFLRHVADLQTLAEIVERHGGKLTVQAQTPFTRKLVETKNPLFSDLEQRGHELALHFHEDAHLGRDSGSLPVGTWAKVMQEEIDWIKKAGATRVRYWSGGNLYPAVLEAAAQAGLDVMSDYKNPRTQKDDERLLFVHPWRPGAGPVENDLAGFAVHSSNGKIIYLPNGVFEQVDHSAMRRSADTGGDYPYFDALTRGLELSLKAARPDRVNVFHITVHAGEFRGRRGEMARPFAVIDDWLAQVVVPLVKAGKVRWATFSEMADAFKSWEKKNPGVNPRCDAAAQSAEPTAIAEESNPMTSATQPGARKTAQPFITFAVNCHDWRFVDESADTVLRLIGIFEKYGVHADFYLTAPLVEHYLEKRPDVVHRLKESRMTISYHTRPPHPLWRGFSEPLRGKAGDELAAALRDYESFRLDLRTGELDRTRSGGYRYVEEVFGRKPVAVGASDAAPEVKRVSSRVCANLGARVAVFHHETGTKIEQPFEFRDGLLARPSDFSVTRFATPDNPQGVFWWGMMGTPRAAEFDPVALLERQLKEWRGDRAPFITALIHENDFYREGGPGWNSIYFTGQGPQARPRRPPFDLHTPPAGRARRGETREAIFHKYEELVARAATTLRVVTSEDIAALAQQCVGSDESGKSRPVDSHGDAEKDFP